MDRYMSAGLRHCAGRSAASRLFSKKACPWATASSSSQGLRVLSSGSAPWLCCGLCDGMAWASRLCRGGLIAALLWLVACGPRGADGLARPGARRKAGRWRSAGAKPAREKALGDGDKLAGSPAAAPRPAPEAPGEAAPGAAVLAGDAPEPALERTWCRAPPAPLAGVPRWLLVVTVDCAAYRETSGWEERFCGTFELRCFAVEDRRAFVLAEHPQLAGLYGRRDEILQVDLSWYLASFSLGGFSVDDDVELVHFEAPLPKSRVVVCSLAFFC